MLLKHAESMAATADQALLVRADCSERLHLLECCLATYPVHGCSIEGTLLLPCCLNCDLLSSTLRRDGWESSMGSSHDYQPSQLAFHADNRYEIFPVNTD